MDKAREGGILISKIHYLAGRILTKKLKQYHLDEINPAQGRILFVLWQHNGITIQELAKRTLLGKSTLTSMLDRLEMAGYLNRVPSKEDRRKIIIELGEKDRALQEVYLRVSEEMTEMFYHGFNSKEIDGFEGYLNRILNNLMAYSPDQPLQGG